MIVKAEVLPPAEPFVRLVLEVSQSELDVLKEMFYHDISVPEQVFPDYNDARRVKLKTLMGAVHKAIQSLRWAKR